MSSLQPDLSSLGSILPMLPVGAGHPASAHVIQVRVAQGVFGAPLLCVPGRASGCVRGRGQGSSRCCEDMLVSKRFRNAVIRYHLLRVCCRSHPSCSPSSRRWPQPSLSSGAFTASLPEHIYPVIHHPGNQCAKLMCMYPFRVACPVPGAC